MTAAARNFAHIITVIQEGISMTDAQANAQTKRDENVVSMADFAKAVKNPTVRDADEATEAVKPTIVGRSYNLHSGHNHPMTKAGRAACRKAARDGVAAPKVPTVLAGHIVRRVGKKEFVFAAVLNADNTVTYTTAKDTITAKADSAIARSFVLAI